MSNANSVLLANGGYYGTLAAARYFGRRGIKVYLADSSRLTQTHWSRYVAQTVQAPAITKLDAFYDWLLSFGKSHPGTFLYPTSDDMSWLLASRQQELQAYFRMYQPPLAAIVALLDKSKLYAACQAVGIDTPDTRFPRSERELESMAPALELPVLIKPRTQMLLASKLKGQIVSARQDLIEKYRDFRAHNTYAPELLAHDPDISWPMLQRFLPEAKSDTYSISGFVSKSGHVHTMRASRKVLQRPRNLGIGLCFVSEAVDETLAAKLLELCRHTGYFGAFESEFVQTRDGRQLLIDLNPRFYGQMGFEIARDMPLPGLVFDAANSQGTTPSVPPLPPDQRVGPNKRAHYSNLWLFELLMLTQRLSGRIGAEERKSLRDLLHNPQSRYVDAVYDADDLAPLLADLAVNLQHFARHPRDFVRKFFLDA